VLTDLAVLLVRFRDLNRLEDGTDRETRLSLVSCIPGTKEPLNYGLDCGRYSAIGLPTVGQESIIVSRRVEPDQ
jgi:hypothetical protein